MQTRKRCCPHVSESGFSQPGGAVKEDGVEIYPPTPLNTPFRSAKLSAFRLVNQSFNSGSHWITGDSPKGTLFYFLAFISEPLI